jgi:hypothetical protein
VHQVLFGREDAEDGAFAIPAASATSLMVNWPPRATSNGLVAAMMACQALVR